MLNEKSSVPKIKFNIKSSLNSINYQFAIEGFSKPYRLDITSNSGGLLFYVKANLPSKLIRFYNFPSEIHAFR